MNTIKKTLEQHDFVLVEAAVVEILRRSEKVSFHPELIHSHLIYDEQGIRELTKIFNSYIAVAKEKEYPFIMCAPTWRANKENVLNSKVKNSINRDSMEFMKGLRSNSGNFGEKIFIGGTIGPKNDCYSPKEGLSKEASEEFHTWQISELKKGGADFIIAETLPNVQEALGIARACEKQDIDYILSFVIARDGKILDGSSISDAIEYIDNNTTNTPIGYAVNCAYPSFLCVENQPKKVFYRLIGYLANASSLDHCDLDNSENLMVDSISDWGEEMLKLNREYGVKMLGGCCGTNQKHLNYLITH